MYHHQELAAIFLILNFFKDLLVPIINNCFAYMQSSRCWSDFGAFTMLCPLLHVSNELCLNWFIDQRHLIQHWLSFYFCLCSFLPLLKLWCRTMFYHYTLLKWNFFFGSTNCVWLIDTGFGVIYGVCWFKLLACIAGSSGGANVPSDGWFND